ncbi:hypothetical protein F5Y05DRAFT_281883 [Hypoxylon sp. FL0543]|nr:hypothetical protein F5Y05DRAFT_281883 [Hypoxylon sp. FL0543]
MSRFAVYCDWITTVRKCLDGDPPPGHLATFHLQKGPIRFPLAGIEHSTRVALFYRELLAEVDRSRLQDKRKELYREFQHRVISAHVAVDSLVSMGTIGKVSKLREPLAQLQGALDAMTELKAYDDKHPVRWYEVFPAEDIQFHLSPGDLWLHFKLESVRPCLVFLVRLLRQVLPNCEDIWTECEASLLKKEWIRQFILDSPDLPEDADLARPLMWNDWVAHQAQLHK